MFEVLIPDQWVDNIRQLDGGEFGLILFFLVGLSLAALYGIFRFFYRARLIEDIPTSRIRSAAQGYVELDGLAELMAGEPIVAPLTGHRCTWFSYKVEERVEHPGQSRGGRRHWRTIESGVSDNLFLLRDETGDCLIDPEGAEVTPSVNCSWSGATPRPAGMPPPGGQGLFNGGRYRYNEQRIDVADSLYAIGWFTTIGGTADLPNSQDELRALLHHWKRNPEMLRPFDLNGDGQIDGSEWAAVRRVAMQQLQGRQSERLQRVHHLLSKPGHRGTPFIISVLSQSQLVSRLKGYAAGSLLAFILLGSIASWMVALRVGS